MSADRSCARVTHRLREQVTADPKQGHQPTTYFVVAGVERHYEVDAQSAVPCRRQSVQVTLVSRGAGRETNEASGDLPAHKWYLGCHTCRCDANSSLRQSHDGHVREMHTPTAQHRAQQRRSCAVRLRTADVRPKWWSSRMFTAPATLR